MTEPTQQDTAPKSVVEAVLGQQAARAMARSSEMAQRQAELDARHERIKNRVGLAVTVTFGAALVFLLAMGCLAAWNAVVG